MVDAVMFASGSSRWRTPDILFRPLMEEFDFQVDLAAEACNAKLPVYIDKETDALSLPDWGGVRGFCNPPWGKKCKPGMGVWVARFELEARVHGSLIGALLPARIDTRWFHDYVIGKAEIRIIDGRVTFDDPDTGEPAPCSAPFPMMACIWHPFEEMPLDGEIVSSWDPYGRKAA